MTFLFFLPDDDSSHVESDTDAQLMIYIPFQSNLKVHSIHLTSLPSSTPPDADTASPFSRPKLVQIYTNRPHILGFDEAEDIQPTQEITLTPRDWDSKTNTAKVDLRFVKFQNVSSLVLFVVEAEDDDAERTRLDRIRIVGESGEKRDGKIEKISMDE